MSPPARKILQCRPTGIYGAGKGIRRIVVDLALSVGAPEVAAEFIKCSTAAGRANGEPYVVRVQFLCLGVEPAW